MFKKRSQEKELLDDFSVNSTELEQNLDEMAFFNRWNGSKRLLLSALDDLAQENKKVFKETKLTLADLGCGEGDLLREINSWARKNKYSLQLIGIDASSQVLNFAREKSHFLPEISYQTMDILSNEFSNQQFDIITLNSVCHHFDDASLLRLLNKIKDQVRIAIVINDLQRSFFSYFFIKYFTKFFSYSNLAKNDGPVSVLRAFHRCEWIDLLKKSNSKYKLQWCWAFRWKIIIYP